MTVSTQAHPSRIEADAPGVAEALAAIRSRIPKADPLSVLPDVHPAKLPRHVAIIMDGNGRWAASQGFPRSFGHRGGAASVRAVMEASVALGIEQLTLFSFSSENWKRPPDEVTALMDLCRMYVAGERESMIRNGLRFRVIGRRDRLPPDVVAEIEATEQATASARGVTLCLAIDYGSREEIVRAARRLAARAAVGELRAADITEEDFARSLDTAGMPEPDLLIRTAGELRLSNFLLWQLSYAELYVTDVLWPEFGVAEFHAAIRAFAARRRRFGGLDDDAAR